jgi:hypothetical protein
VARGAEAAVRVDRPAGELVAAIAAAGPYDLIVDYLWGEPAEAVFAALMRPARTPDRIRYILVGMAAGEVAGVPAIALRRAPVQLAGSGIGGPASLEAAGAAYADLLKQVVAGEIVIDAEPVPLAEAERPGPSPTAASGSSSNPELGCRPLRRSQSSMREPMMTVRSRGRWKYSAASEVIREVATNRRLRQRLMPGVVPRRSSMVDRK